MDDIIEDLYRKYALNIQRMCYLYLGNMAASEDAMQETFLKAYEKYHLFRGRSDIKTWLTRIAINTCKDMLRREKRKNIPVHNEIPEDRQGFKDSLESTIDKMMVSEAIQNLSCELREVIILFYYQELSTKVIGTILHIPRTSVEFRLKKARNELKKMIGEEIFYE